MPTEYKAQTGQTLVIKPPSSISQAIWADYEVTKGGKATLEILTQFVADDSTVQVELYNESAKKVTTVQGKVVKNRCLVKVPVTEPVGTLLKGLVKFPAHKLECSTSSLRVIPALDVASFEWIDPEGNAITVITDEASVDAVVKLADMPDGSPCQVSLRFREQNGKNTIVLSKQVRVRDAALRVTWIPGFPRKEIDHEHAEQVKPEGGKYKNPQLFISVTYKGSSAESPPTDYGSWTTYKVEGASGKVKLRYPDGRMEILPIPENGQVKIKNPGVGGVEVMDLLPD